MNDKLRINWDDIEQDWEDFITLNDEPFTGIVYENWPDGTLRSETEIENGLRKGFDRNWYESGQPQAESYHDRSVKSGFSREWFENGQLKQEIIWEWGIMIQKRHWDENEKLISEYQITSDSLSFKTLQIVRAQHDKNITNSVDPG
jgi:antitoxin component YwqK of YwqJK toxin-antitoxin module